MPAISVIVPVYQAEKFIKKCVESVVKQTFSDWELLLIDDGCTDGSDDCTVETCDEHRKDQSGHDCGTDLGVYVFVSYLLNCH